MNYSISIQKYSYSKSPILPRIGRELAMTKFPELRFVVSNCVICLVFLTICHLQNLRIWTLADSTNPVCNSPECRRLGDYFTQNMNQRVNPCDNFYDYVCGKWGVQYPRPKYQETWNVDRLLDYRVTLKLKSFFEDKVVTHDPEFEKAKTMYRGCMNLPYMQRDSPNTIKETMKKIGNWPMFLPEKKELPQNIHWSQIDDQYIAIAGESAFFYHRLVSNKHHDKITVLMTHLHSPFGMFIVYDKPLGSKEMAHYKTFLTELIKIVAPTNPVPFMRIIDKDLNDVIKFRLELYKIIKSASKKEIYEYHTIVQFQDLYNRKAKSKDTAKIPWLSKIRSMYKNSKNIHDRTISATEFIAMDLNYFTKLADLLGKTAKRVLVNHIHLYFAERHVRLNTQLEGELQKSLEFKGFPYNKIRYEPARWQQCIQDHDMTTTLGQIYVTKFFSKNDENRVYELFYDVKNLLKQQISESTWLSFNAKAIAENKVNFMTGEIGFPYSFLSPLTNSTEEESISNPLQATAYFEDRNEKLYISAAYLQWPIYNQQVPYVIDYGSTISMLGHEVYHGFDTRGVKYYQGVSVNWMAQNVYKEFKKRVQCFQHQYDEYNREESVKEYLLSPFEIPRTYDEDMPDVMGLKLAYKGYRQKLQRNKGICPVLPGFEKLGCEKLFFIAFANAFCENSSVNAQKALIWFDSHSLPWVRVNGAVANMPEFSKAFNCKSTDVLAPKKTCDLWKN